MDKYLVSKLEELEEGGIMISILVDDIVIPVKLYGDGEMHVAMQAINRLDNAFDLLNEGE